MEKRIKCLLVDDDIDDQEIFQMCLQKVDSAIECVVASNGIEALRKVSPEEKYIPDLIFLDVNMPKMNGIECLRQLRSQKHLQDVKIYMYSTTSEKSVVTEVHDLGATDFIVKPTKTAHLREKLAIILQTSHSDNAKEETK